MIIGLTIFTLVLAVILAICAANSWEHEILLGVIALILFIFFIGLFIFGYFHGFIYQPPTEGTHQGVITAVDLEGVYFRRYEVYLKSSKYTNQKDETKYLLYENEKELAEQLKNAIGKTVKINYGHDGGYIGWNSCGTYHIKSIEILENQE